MMKVHQLFHYHQCSTIAEDGGGSITLTATSSIATYEDITVTVSTSGTATEGTDYTRWYIHDITISAGATTGTATLHLAMIHCMKIQKQQLLI